MNNLNLKIDKEKCIKCGLCVKDCPTCSLEFGENDFPKTAKGGEKRCMKCQHCLAICPTGALSVFDKNPDDSELVNHNLDSEQIRNIIKSRKSFRQYKQENLPEETINKLKDILHWVPTGCNNHGLHFSFIDDIEVMNEFRNYTNAKIIKILSNGFVSGVLKKFSWFKDAMISGQDVVFRGAPHMIVVSTPKNAPCANIDPIIALSYFELYAQSLGVGTLWCGFGQMCLTAFPELCDKLEIPENHKASYVMMFGPKDIKYTRTTQPDLCTMTTVSKGEIKSLSLIERLKRNFWTI